MRLYGEVRHGHGPLFRWTATEHRPGTWTVRIDSKDSHRRIEVDAGHDLLTASAAITDRIVHTLTEENQ